MLVMVLVLMILVLFTRCEVRDMLVSWPLHHPVLLGYPTLQ